MNGFLKGPGLRILATVLALILCAGVIFAFWYSEQPKFHNVTVELGEEFPGIQAFLTDYAVESLSRFVTPVSKVDMSKPGIHSVALTHGTLKEIVAFQIVDTVAPVVEFTDVTIHIDDVLTADAFIKSIDELSETTVSFEEQPQKPDTFGAGSVTVIVTDTSGNITKDIRNVEYVWIVPNYTLELGDTLHKSDLRPWTNDDAVLSQTLVDTLNEKSVGTYNFTSYFEDKSCDCTVTIVDTTPPEVETTDITAFVGDTVTVDDFIVTVSDVSGVHDAAADVELSTDAVCDKSVLITVTDSSGNKTVNKVKFTVKADTEAPVFSGIDSMRLQPGDPVDFTAGVSVTDNADKGITYTCDSSNVNVNVIGIYSVKYVAVDRAGNKTEVIREVAVVDDAVPPVISGLTDMTVEKNSSPDFNKGVSATDSQDGTVAFTCDTSALDLSKAGTFYITYTAVDSAGNAATATRKVFVNYDSSDVDLLVADIAAKLSDDPEEIRDYVRNTIGYNRYWGGETPVWYGFKNKVGNCYVHALCLQALFNEKGIENMLIWDTDRSHYWNLVKINGQWKHIDSTPSRPHTTYSLMNDTQRYNSLISGNWDRSQWPACT